MSTINPKSNWRELTPIEENQLSLGLSAFFSGSAFLFATCGSEFQGQASLVEKEARPYEANFEKWYESENREIQAPKSNATVKLESSIQLTYRYKEVDWNSFKKLKIPSSLAIYQNDGLPLLPNYPFSSSRSYPIC